MKRGITLVLTVFLIVSYFSFPSYATNKEFSDVKANDWFYGDVQRLVNMGAISGFSDGTFKPRNTITRAEFVKILVMALKYQIVSGNSFSDTENHWAKDSISTAIANGVIVKSEYGDSFLPEKPITRLEMAKMMVRALKLNPSNGTSPFADINDGYTTAAYSEYLIMGSTAGGRRYFYPNNNATRAEASAIVVRAVDYEANSAGYKAKKEKEIQKAITVNNIDLPDINGNSKPSKEQILYLLKKYDEDGNFILNEAVKRNEDIMNWFHSDSFLDDIGTAVHEECHGFTHLYPYEKYGYDGIERSSFYIGNGNIITVKHTNVFPSKEMSTTIPQSLRTFRYKTYVGEPSENLSSDVNGVYGLLNEFTAYYYGTKSDYNLYDYYMTYTKSPEKWLDYISGVEGQYFAYAEFKYYILKYLLYARDNHKQVYDGIMENSEFKAAYNTIDQKFFGLIEDYFNRKKELIKYLQSKGYNAREDEKYFWIGNKGRGVFIKEYNLLMTEMDKTEYQDIIQELKK